MTPPATVQPIAAAGISELGEGPVWDERCQQFFWVDIDKGNVHALDPATGNRRTFAVGSTVGFAVPTTDPNRMLAARGTSVVVLDLTSGEAREFCEMENGDTTRLNDGKCDPAGRLWAGTMPFNWGEMTGAFYSVAADGNVRAHLSNIGCSNGLAWNPASNAFYYIDSLKHRIDRHHWNALTGEIAFDRTLKTFDDKEGMPDGMCIDAEGHLWVAFWNGGCVRRIDADSGERLAQIDLPARQITSCAFGGTDFATLYITSARTGLSENDLAKQPLAGSVFTTRPGVCGLPADRFAWSAN